MTGPELPFTSQSVRQSFRNLRLTSGYRAGIVGNRRKISRNYRQITRFFTLIASKPSQNLHSASQTMRTSLLFLLLTLCSTLGAASPPRLFDPRLKLDLVLEHPRIVTPTGISIDPLGRVWVVECNTHFPPPGYTGHSSDRIWTIEVDRDGRARKQTLFADGLFATMSIAVRPDGDVYIATRKEIFLMRDTNGDGKADHQQRLFFLETESKYPHDALGGFAFDPLDRLYFGCGENEGQPYRLLGPDDKPVHIGGGEGGNVFRCRLDGSRFEHWSTGYWNPHASACDAFGNIFTVDNDPDSRPPCRLMHAVAGSDFGYRYRNGRRGTHPFSAWNGELPGTLPMTAGTGEAPSGIVAYEADLLPEEYRGTLLVGSWGDYRIDRFRLTPHGSSFTSQIEPIVKGDDQFRPVGLALAPDGSVYFTDWVKRDYEVHGQGRVWRLSVKEKPAQAPTDLPPEKLLGHPHQAVRREAARLLQQRVEGRQTLDAVLRDPQQSERARLEALWGLLRSSAMEEHPSIIQRALAENRSDVVATAAVRELSDAALIKTLFDLYFVQAVPAQDQGFRLAILSRWNPAAGWKAGPQQFAGYFREGGALDKLLDDPFLFGTLRDRLRKTWPAEVLPFLRSALDATPRSRQLSVLLNRDLAPRETAVVERLLHDPDGELRRMGVQWAAEERMTDLRDEVEGLLADPQTTPALFSSILAAIEMYNGTPGLKYEDRPQTQILLPIIADTKRPAQIRALALRLVDPRTPELTPDLFRELLKQESLELRSEAVGTLLFSQPENLTELLQPVIADEQLPSSIRAEALMALAVRLPQKTADDPALSLVGSLLESPNGEMRIEALRALRGWPRSVPYPESKTLHVTPGFTDPSSHGTEQVEFLSRTSGRSSELPALAVNSPKTIEVWKEATASGGDAAFGKRVFFHPQGPGCYRCHQVQGRGERIGPDLSTISRSLDREKLQRSILEPSRDVAPQFVTWTLQLRDGRVKTGTIVQENNNKILLGNAEGKLETIENIDVEERVLQKTSLMPDSLVQQMTVRDLRDLLAYLETLRK